VPLQVISNEVGNKSKDFPRRAAILSFYVLLRVKNNIEIMAREDGL
jgi:hypothetical protein